MHELQRRLPKARIVYASATGASEPRNMAYMTRLGIWGPGTPFPGFMDFIHAVEKRLVLIRVSLCFCIINQARVLATFNL